MRINTFNLKISGADTGFIKMLAWIQVLGEWGHSAGFEVGCDGDGNARYKFSFDSEEENLAFKEAKRFVAEQYKTSGDIKSFII